ncbi:MAG TPA: hypothetical protein VFT04_02755 [Gemmatimonadales bacterium]|nr:hypothetical protein [Gemmatimonadales bacterium]
MRSGFLSVSALSVSGMLLLASCGGRAASINTDQLGVGDRWNATLATPAQLIGAVQVTGNGWMAADENPARTRAGATLANATPGGEHPWHVHVGRCGSNGAIVGGASSYRPLKVGRNGRAEATATLDLALPRSGEYYINVHASAANLGTIIACGNLAPPTR